MRLLAARRRAMRGIALCCLFAAGPSAASAQQASTANRRRPARRFELRAARLLGFRPDRPRRVERRGVRLDQPLEARRRRADRRDRPDRRRPPGQPRRRGHQGRQAVRARHGGAHVRRRRLDAPAKRREDVDAAHAHGPGDRGRYPGRGDQPVRLPVRLTSRPVPDRAGVLAPRRQRGRNEEGGFRVHRGTAGRPAAGLVPRPRRRRRHGRLVALQPEWLLLHIAPVRAGPRDVLLFAGGRRSQRRACLRQARERVRHPGALPVGAAGQLQLERVSGRRRRRGSRALCAVEPVDHPRRGDPAALQRCGRAGCRTRWSRSSPPTPSTCCRTSRGTGVPASCRPSSSAPTDRASISARRPSWRSRETGRPRRRRPSRRGSRTCTGATP